MSSYLNLSNLISQLTNSQGLETNQTVLKPGESMPASDAKNVVEQIKNMLLGEIFTGEIMEIKEDTASIRLGNGQTFQANLVLEQNPLPFQKGEMVTFLVDGNSDNKISLKPLDANAQEIMVAQKALNASGLAINKENIELVKGLLDLNLPIDKHTLNEVAKLLNHYEDAPMDTILRLYKLNMPVTQENIEQFNTYKNYEHDMTQTLKNVTSELLSMLQDSVESFAGKDGGVLSDMDVAKQITSDFLKVLLSDDSGETEKNPSAEGLREEPVPGENGFEKVVLQDNQQSATSRLSDFVKQFLEQETNIPKPMENFSKQELPKDIVSKLVSDKEFMTLVSETIQEKMFLKPENVANKKEVQDFYKKLLDFVKNTQNVLEKNGKTDMAVAKGMESIKNNLEFMNDLNHQMAYMQIPIKMQNGETRGDLYVYTNRKAKQGKSDALTALLHLDMKYLGPMDVYVKLSGQSNVSTNFCLESEELLDFIYEHIDELTKRLEDKGYTFQPTMTLRDSKDEQPEEKPVDFVKDFLDVADPVTAVNQFMFDTKA